MNNFLFPVSAILALVCSLSTLHADNGSAAKSAPPPAAGINDDALKALSNDEVRTLIRITSLPPEKLASLRRSIEQLEKMTPEEKRALRKKLEDLRNAGPNEIRRINEQRPNNFLARYWSSLPPEQAKVEMDKFQKMNREERRAYVSDVSKKTSQRSPDRSDNKNNRPEQRRRNDKDSPGPDHSERPARDYEPFHPSSEQKTPPPKPAAKQ